MSDAAGQLRAFVERVERVEEEIAELNTDKRDIYAEAKGCGFDVPTLKKVVRLRKLDVSERMEADALLDTYLAALGMLPDAGSSRVHVHVREEADTDTGEITEPQPSEAAVQAGRASLPLTTSHVESEAAEISTPNAGSSNGRTADFDSANAGSTPAPATTYLSPDAPFHDPNDVEDEDGAKPIAPVVSRADRVKRLRPHCQNPTACGSSDATKHCWRCSKAMTEAGVPA